MHPEQDPFFDWHRLFGLILMDFFRDTPVEVQTELDLSLKQQFLDVVLHLRGAGPFPFALPDGFDDLGEYNLLTFKSFREALTAWVLKELIAHYVNLRKRASPSLKELLPEDRFRLFAVTARFPRDLATQVKLEPLREGVYQCLWGTDRIRILVLNQLPKAQHNAPWHLFSAQMDQVAYAAEHYEIRSPDSSTLLLQLFAGYRKEGLPMPYTMEDFREYFRNKFVEEMTPEERDRFLRRLPPEERLRGLPAEERLRGLPPEERLRGLPPEEIERYLKNLQGNPAAPPKE